MSAPLATSHFQLRRADLRDVTDLVELRLQFLEEVNQSPMPSGLRESLHTYFLSALSTGDFIAWLAVAEGKVVGTSGLVLMQRPPSYNNVTGRDAYIMNIYTVSQWRGYGIGTTLFEKILEAAQTSGAGRAFLHATPQGRPLYEKFGFRAKSAEAEMERTLNP